jgi:DNA repair protein RadC
VAEGAGRFGDAELLALLLETGVAGRSALGVATDLLERFGTVRALARHQVTELAAVKGVGVARAVRVLAALELGRRALGAPPAAVVVDTPEAAFRVLGPRLQGLAEEELHALYLDRRRRPVAHRRLTVGSDAFTVVEPRQVLRVAVGLGAHAVLLAHNHPSGDPTPSAQDREVTARVARAGAVLGVPLLDHLVVGDGGWVSLAAEGLLPAYGPPPPTWTAEPG